MITLGHTLGDLTGIHREGGEGLGTVTRDILAFCLLCSVSEHVGVWAGPVSGAEGAGVLSVVAALTSTKV